MRFPITWISNGTLRCEHFVITFKAEASQNKISTYRSVEALSDSLSEWGEEEGAIVVISHDKNFCDKVGFTHVATVKDGSLVVEQRNPNAADWDSSAATMQRSSDESLAAGETNGVVKEVDRELKKQAYNAPKRISKIELLVEQKEEKIAALEAEMQENGSDVGKLVDLTEEKDKLGEQVMKLMAEWEELEEVLLQVAA